MRIISGERRGAKLLTPKGTSTRPTRGRIKEALFNILSGNQFINTIRQRIVIDAFAGSGALGLRRYQEVPLFQFLSKMTIGQ